MPPPVVRVPKYVGRGAFVDVPAYTGNASKALVVNGAGNGFQYVAVALAAHAHDAADITSGTIADARIASTITRDNEVMGLVLAADGSGSGLDADLVRGVTPSAYILALIDDADAATARATLGLGALATAGVPGSTTQVIFNSAGALAGDAGMTYDAANDALTVAGRVVTPAIRAAADGAFAFQVQTAGGTAYMTGDSTNQVVGIKTSPSSIRSLYVYSGNLSLSSGEYRTVEGLASFTGDGTSANLRGIFATAKVANTGSSAITGRIVGVESDTFAGGTNASLTVSDLRGFYATAYNQNANAVTTIYGINIRYGNAGAGAVGTAYGAYLDPFKSGAGAITTMYGLYVGAVSAATTNYSIYTNAGDVRLMAGNSDKIGFHGVTPVARQLLATGAGATVDQVITVLQNLGLVRQS